MANGPAGQFVPQEGAQPAIGQVGTPERVEEERVEVVVRASAGAGEEEGADGGVEMHRVLEELKKVRAPSLLAGVVLTRGGLGGTGASVRGGGVRCVQAGALLDRADRKVSPTSTRPHLCNRWVCGYSEVRTLHSAP